MRHGDRGNLKKSFMLLAANKEPDDLMPFDGVIADWLLPQDCLYWSEENLAMRSQTPSQALQYGRNLIRELAVRHRTANPRVFGSVLTGRDRADSDLDVLVEPLPETTLFDLGGLQDALEEALGVRVDVKTPMDLPPHIRAEVLRQALPV
ncbi:nucleotidyltransferase family protein [Paracoccus benzoatiresistens]|jgi:uncharacterized protein|uniref:Nucleotidyltransferase family protein n=1 Tax=Paracoccus benzoatiresistens TaxID=2997341 RepID=A0ABT4J5R9_9RHOB|nr:nucleotidyltransferase family protein [Paracoccus sp. EF6]MCZ0962475.1 nucleotidyltransferase family protein [Paracoccus sp. EF6]